MKYILLLFISLLTYGINAQELNCQVNIQTNPSLDITTKEKEIFQELEQSITELMNNTVWTKDNYEVEERINCVFQLSITDVRGGGSFKGTLQVQATRPVFNTTYNTTLLNHLDEDIVFAYQKNAKLMFSENQYTDNLSSILAFYAYYILALDGDSFAPQGGSIYFSKAQNVVSLAQSSMQSGWKPDNKNKRSRFWLVDNAMHELFSPLRECYYDYHRKGLDNMYEDQAKARNEIYTAIEKLLAINKVRPSSENVVSFIYAKRNELQNIFKDAEKKQQTEMVNVLKRLDPANSSKYQEMLQ